MQLTQDFYDDVTHPDTWLSDVEKCFTTKTLDPDGFSHWHWVKALGQEDEFVEEVLQTIIKNKDDPKFKGMYDYFEAVVRGVLNK
jgi:hypothetical protein